MDHLRQVRSAASALRSRRTLAFVAEQKLQEAVAGLIGANDGGLRDWARSMGISPQYACDIRHGRRKISDAVVKKILGAE